MINYNSSIVADFVEKGYSERCPILDMHSHMFAYYGACMAVDTPEKQIKSMDKANVLTAVFASHSTLNEGKAFVPADIEVARRYPGRFLCYYPVLSRLTEPDKDLKYMEENKEYIGFKFLCDYYHLELGDEVNVPYFEYADAHGLPVLCHTWGASDWSGPAQVEKLLKKYHNIKLIIGHSLYGRIPQAVELAKEYPNLTLEMTALLPYRGNLETVLDAGMSDRIVFGVDNPWFSYDAYTGAMISTGIGDEEMKNILYRNAAKLLRDSGVSLPQYPED